jgi:signal transduction histidine kinase/CheY-like chemotaxis protein
MMSIMTRPLKVLILDDVESDALLMVHELKQGGFQPDWKRVDNENHYLIALGSFPDLILSDYNLPQFDAFLALKLMQEKKLDIPFIVISGAITEEVAVEFMKQGASDYLLKDRMARLGQAVVRALEQRELREEKRRSEDALRVRAMQQEVVANLGLRALAGLDLAALMNEAVVRLAQTLGVEYCEVLELMPDGKELLLAAGFGWEDGLVGQAKVSSGRDLQAGYTLHSSGPVIVEDQGVETRFHSSTLLQEHSVISGMSVVISGQERQFGVLGAHTARRQTFTADDVYFFQAVANLLAMVIEQKLVENELEKHREHLEDMVAERTQRLKDAERLVGIGETAVMIGHDLRNPLQAIVTTTFLARSKVESLVVPKKDVRLRQSVLDDLQTIEEQSVYMNKIVSDLRDYARPLRTEMTQVDLISFMKKVLSNMRMPENIEVHMEIDEGLNWEVDTTMMKRVLINLITNAVQAMPQGGLLTVAATRSDEDMVLTLKDSGAGIPPEILPEIFHPLFTTKAKGMGLGLAVVKRLSEAQGGDISVESEMGIGTTVVIRMSSKTRNP